MASKTLIVLRHGKSSWANADTDLGRPLSERGLGDTVVAGQILAEYPIDVALVSSANRAQQTWERAQLGGARAADVRSSDAIYHALASEVLLQLHELDESLHTALLVGHQPTLSELIVDLAKPSDLVDRIATKFPTSGLAVLSFDGSWKELAAGAATLERFEIPRAPKN